MEKINSSILDFSNKLFDILLNFDHKNNYKDIWVKIGFQYYAYLIFIKYTIKFIIFNIITRFFFIFIFCLIKFDKEIFFNYVLNMYFDDIYYNNDKYIELGYLFITNILIIYILNLYINKILTIYEFRFTINNNIDDLFFSNNVLIYKKNKLTNDILMNETKIMSYCHDNDFELININNKSKYFKLKDNIYEITEFENNKEYFNFFTRFIYKNNNFNNIDKLKNKLEKFEFKNSKYFIILFKNFNSQNTYLNNIWKIKNNYNNNELINSETLTGELNKEYVSNIQNREIINYPNFEIENLIFTNLNMKILYIKLIRVLLTIFMILSIIFLSTPAAILQSATVIFKDLINIEKIPIFMRKISQNRFLPTFMIILINLLIIVLIDYNCKYQIHLKFSNYQLNVLQISFLYLFINIILLPMLSLGYGHSLYSNYKDNKATFMNYFKKINLKNNDTYFYEFILQSAFFGFIFNFGLFSEFFANKFSYNFMWIKRTDYYKNFWRKKEFDTFQIGYYVSNFLIFYFILILFGLYNTKLYFLCFLKFITRLISDSCMIFCYYGKEIGNEFKIIKSAIKRIKMSIYFLNIFLFLKIILKYKNGLDYIKWFAVLIMFILIFKGFLNIDNKIKKVKNISSTNWTDKEIKYFKENRIFQN